MTDRQSIADEAPLIDEPEALAAREANNAVEQFDRVLDLIDVHVRDRRPFRLRPSMIMTLHGVAMAGVHRMAGTFRNAPVSIQGSKHIPPDHQQVPALVEDMCDWIEAQWSTKSALALCAYTMWRLNWIHPFADGNGRTSRAVAYLVLCVRAGDRLPGRLTIPEQIAADKKPYYDALEQSDQTAEASNPGLTVLEELLQCGLVQQLGSAFDAATAQTADGAEQRKFH